MSGMIDFLRESPVPDVPLELETGVSSTGYIPGLNCGCIGIAFGNADADVVVKEPDYSS